MSTDRAVDVGSEVMPYNLMTSQNCRSDNPRWANARMISMKWWLFLMVVLCTDRGISKNHVHLGCFRPSKFALKAFIRRPHDQRDSGPAWCVNYCRQQNYTFAAIEAYSQLCRCDNRLKDSTRVPLEHCLSPCNAKGQCGKRDRVMLYVLDAPPTHSGPTGKSDKEDDAHAALVVGTGVHRGKEAWDQSYDQLLILGGGVGAAVALLAILVHCARVSRMRSRLLKVYITQLKRGETDAITPPGTFTISNQLCLDFFCCCCDRKQDDLEYDELLNDIEPARKGSFNAKVKQYLNKCEADKEANREELRKILRTLSKSGSISKVRSSARSLGEPYVKSRRQRQQSDPAANLSDLSNVSLRGATSCPSRVGGRDQNSSACPIEKTFRSHSSSRTMYTRRSPRHGDGGRGHDVAADDDDTVTSSPIRLLPVPCRNSSQNSSENRYPQGGSKTRRPRPQRLVWLKGVEENTSDSQSD
ncbi:uncharacterized protein LOC124114734 [Haliotis rufescens]|uniref:uncharacterized protein LOC124114734 n=1 Tax=Haliotis rufescens TaxID=6454 RepID=UPI00201EA310|nr:uncharacterized protein LOC124114734 [Haliotis rufescens]